MRVGSAKGGSTKNPRQHVRGGIHKGGTDKECITHKEEGIFDDEKLKQLQNAQIVPGFKLNSKHLTKLLDINDQGYQYKYTGYYIDNKLAAIMVYYTHPINDFYSNFAYSYLKIRHNFLKQLAVNLEFMDVNTTVIEYLYSPVVGRDIELLENRIDKLEELECLLLMKPDYSLETRYDISRINDYTKIKPDKRIQEYDNIPLHDDNVDYKKNEWEKWWSNCDNNQFHRIYFMWGGEKVRTELNEFCNNQKIINDMKSSEVPISSLLSNTVTNDPSKNSLFEKLKNKVRFRNRSSEKREH